MVDVAVWQNILSDVDDILKKNESNFLHNAIFRLCLVFLMFLWRLLIIENIQMSLLYFIVQ